MSASRLLLAVSTSRYSEHLVEVIMTEAQRLQAEGASVEIHVLYVIENEELERVASSVGDTGFLGTAPQQDILDTLASVHDRTALRRVEEVKAAAKEAGIPVTFAKVSGRFDKQVIAHAEQHHVDVIFLTRADRPFISRFLFGSDADRVARLARSQGLGTVIIDE